MAPAPHLTNGIVIRTIIQAVELQLQVKMDSLSPLHPVSQELLIIIVLSLLVREDVEM